LGYRAARLRHGSKSLEICAETTVQAWEEIPGGLTLLDHEINDAMR
jgi:hypothetical protein